MIFSYCHENNHTKVWFSALTTHGAKIHSPEGLFFFEGFKFAQYTVLVLWHAFLITAFQARRNTNSDMDVFPMLVRSCPDG